MEIKNQLIPNERNENNSEDEKEKEAVKKYGYLEKEDPYSSANCFSRIFFYWAFRIIKLGNLVSLKTEYFGTLKGKFSSQYFLESIKEQWETKGYKLKKTIPLIRAIFHSNICNIIIVLTMSVISVLLNILSVDLLREYMKRFGMTQEKIDKNKNFYSLLPHKLIGFICLFIKMFEIFFQKNCSIFQMKLIYKSSAQLQGLLFDKLLRVSPSSMKERAEIGQIINFLENDSHKLTQLMMDCPDVFTIPINLIGYCYLLFNYLGTIFLFGLATLLIFVFINIWVIQNGQNLIQKSYHLTDVRMKSIIEAIDNIKIIKLYAWEEEFKNKINEDRENELYVFSQVFKMININKTICFFSPIAVSIVSIGTYLSFHDVLRIEEILSSLHIFTIIRKPIQKIPDILKDFNEVNISMKRIQDYLYQDEINPSNIIINDKKIEEKNISIKIENGNYSWGLPPKSAEEIHLEDLKKSGISFEDIKKKNNNETLLTKEKNTKTDEFTSSDGNPKMCDYSNISTDSSSNNKIVENIYNLDKGLGFDISNELEEGIDPLKPFLKNINFEIKKGEFICIIGEVGCGKSSLIQAILNSMIPLSADSKIYVNGSISYVSQIPWIRNATIRDNILFHLPYDDIRYNKVINLSELSQDLGIFKEGDLIEIGEKGVNLSGGQKARIAIARALYAEKDIYIFDDPISSLDANVGMNVMKNCIIKYLSKKTRILVTHALQYISFADKIFYMNEGEIKWIGTYDEIIKQDFFQSFYEKMKKNIISEELKREKEINQENNNSESFNEDNELNSGVIKRITKDENQEKGRIKCIVYKDFLKKIGICTILITFIVTIVMSASQSGMDLWLSYWTKNQTKSKNKLYFFIYCIFGFIGCAFTYCKERLQSHSNIRLSRKMHQQMIESLIRAPVPTFHDTIPKGQIINRLSNDIDSVDHEGMLSFATSLTTATLFLNSIGVCGFYEPYSLLTILPIFIIGYFVIEYYRNASREIKRMETSLRSPVISLCQEVVPGTVTIRAFGFQNKYVSIFHEKTNEHVKLELINSGCLKWFEMSLDLVSFFFTAFLMAFTMIFKSKFSSQAVSLIFTYSDKMKNTLNELLTTFTNYENSMIQYERCLNFTNIPSEAKLKCDIDDSLMNWPKHGKIEFINYSVKYRPDTDLVLKNINCLIKGKEKVGIVGRTGSGKSTITLCLFRILEATEGRIIIDDIDISNIGLDKLRSNLTIIPQDPALMEGTLRYNIDPLNKSNAFDILKVMKKIGFDYIVKRNNLGLNQEIAEGGSNLSVGEKQLICITRAILRKSKIVVMDEATASIDYKTEELIQKAINEILDGSTFITIAHRIKTILNYDRIIVLDSGEIVAFDSPSNLINDKNSLFYKLYSKSAI